MRQLMRLLVYTSLLLLVVLRFTCGEKNILIKHQKVSKYYENDRRIYVFKEIHFIYSQGMLGKTFKGRTEKSFGTFLEKIIQ